MPNANKLTAAELTELHAETVSAARAARTLANISRRAASLLADGYQIRSYSDTLHVVESPEAKKYVVFHGVETGYSCSCPCFEQWNTCKHLECVDLLKKEDADAAQLDAMEVPGYDVYEYRY